MDVTQGKKRHLGDAYCFEGFRPQAGKIRGVFGKPKARILPLERRSKKHVAKNAEQYKMGGMTVSASKYGIFLVEIRMCILKLKPGVWTAGYAVK